MKIIVYIAVLVGILATTIQAMPQQYDDQEEAADLQQDSYEKASNELASVMAISILDGMMNNKELQDTNLQSDEAAAQFWGRLFRVAKKVIRSPIVKKGISIVGKHVCPKVIKYGR